tara:strand:+ start:293 stop:532 length:240 start_codon:yes stop_codon:yes gene_type:complete
MINKKKLLSGLKIIAFVFPFIFIGPALFLKGNMTGFDNDDSRNLIFLIIGAVTMLIALIGLFMGLKKIIDSLFDEKSNE